MIDPKHRSLVARMAGNIAGNLYNKAAMGTSSENIAKKSVDIAIHILEEVDKRLDTEGDGG